jgi:hypothetical protein
LQASGSSQIRSMQRWLGGQSRGLSQLRPSGYRGPKQLDHMQIASVPVMTAMMDLFMVDLLIS